MKTFGVCCLTAVDEAPEIVAGLAQHVFGGQVADLGDLAGDLDEGGGIIVLADVAAGGPAHGVDAVGFNEQTVERCALGDGGNGWIDGRKWADAHVAAEGEVVVEIIRAGVPVHVVGVGMVAENLQRFLLHAFDVENDGTPAVYGELELIAKPFALLVKVAVAPDVIEADLAEDVHHVYGVDHLKAAVVLWRQMPGVDAAGDKNVRICCGQMPGGFAFFRCGGAHDGEYVVSSEKTRGEI